MYRGNYSLLNVNPGLQFPPLVITIAKPEMTYRFPFSMFIKCFIYLICYSWAKAGSGDSHKFELEFELPIKSFFLLNYIASPVLECHIPF